MHRIIGAGLIGVLAVAAPAWAETAESQPATSQPAASQPATSQPAAADGAAASQPATSQAARAGAAPAPGDVIEPAERRLVGGRLVPTIRVGVDPRVLGVPPGGDPPTLKREGDYVRMRRGRIVNAGDSGLVLFLFEADDEAEAADPPMVLVPCRTLQSMEELVHKRGDRFVFTLSGQILQYRGVNFLVPSMQRPPKAATSQPAESDKDEADPADAILDKLQSRVRGDMLIEPRDGAGGSAGRGTARKGGAGPGRQAMGVAPDTAAAKLKREGEYIRMRRGRIVQSPQGDQILFVFDSDGPEMSDPPMVMVPCLTLERMEEHIRRLGDRTVFLMSGRVYEYRGTNYLLPTMMKLEVKRGNLGR